MESAQERVREAIDWIVLIIESAGAVIIAVGAVLAFIMVIRAFRHALRPDAFTLARLTLGSYLVLGLEFQLAADVLKTAVAPSFTEIGQLAAIAGIRTVLNYFLEKEIAKEKAELGEAMPGLPTIRH
jgi:uncharacterized membrane protein